MSNHSSDSFQVARAPHPSAPTGRSDATTEAPERSRTSRRSFIAGAGAGVLGAGMLGSGALSAAPAFAKGGLSHGDAAILRFLSAAEMETVPAAAGQRARTRAKPGSFTVLVVERQ